MSPLLILLFLVYHCQACSYEICPNHVNITELATRYSDAIVAYEIFLSSAEQGVNDSGTPAELNRQRICADEKIAALVKQFHKNVELAYNNSKTAEHLATDAVDCLQNETARFKYRLTLYSDEPWRPQFLLRCSSEYLKEAEKQLAQIRVISAKLNVLSHRVSYTSRPSILWKHFSMGNLLDIAHLVDPMREIASLIAELTGTPTHYRLQLITDAKIDDLKHKLVNGNCTAVEL